ncbi:MAG: hypothetical protein P9X24_09710 [Candidatus Hatepunaea meridiana]|nr:hypothetical protein [Candidatus Hatepunaea meridiana]
MKQFLQLTIITLTALLIFGCARRENPVTPKETGLILISETKTPGRAMDIFVHSDTMFVADNEIGVTIWDISDITSPVLLNTIETDFKTKRLDYNAERRLLFIIESDQTSVYSLDSLTVGFDDEVFNPQETGAKSVAQYTYSGDTLVVGVVEPGEGHRIYKTFPYEASGNFYPNDLNASISGQYYGLFLDKTSSLSYLAAGQRGLHIMSHEIITGLNAPTLTLIGTADSYGSAYDITLNDDKTLAILADGAGGIQLFDIADSHNPFKVGELRQSNVADVERVKAVGDTVYFIDKYDGLFAADISNPETPVLIGEYDAPSPVGLWVLEDHTVFIADEDHGVLILQWR